MIAMRKMSSCRAILRLILYMYIVCQILNCSHSLPHGCKETKTSLDCSHTNLKTVPKDINNHYTLVNLSGNHITVIPVSAFKNMTKLRVLDLSHNRIRRLERRSFVGLTNLEVLHMDENEMSYDLMNGEEMVELVNLRSLDISRQHVGHRWYPNQTLKVLTQLEVLNVNLVDHAAFGREVGNLSRLRRIEFTTGHLSHFDKKNFMVFNNISIKSVRFTRCGLDNIDNNAFGYLRSLEDLDIRIHTPLTLKRILPSISYISSPLKRLSLDAINGHQHPFNFTEVVLNKLCHLPIEYLQLRDSTITDFAWKLHKCLPGLRYLSLGKNPFLFNYFAAQPNHLLVMWQDLLRLRHLKVLDVSGHGESAVRERIHLKKRVHSLKRTRAYGDNVIKFGLPPNLESFYCRGTFSAHVYTSSVILLSNKLKHVDLSGNRFAEFPVTRQIIGANNVEYFNLASNDLTDIPLGILQNITGLRTLILSGNSLAEKLATDEYGTLFQNMTSVVEIDLSDNAIYTLHVNTFCHLKNVRKVILRSNRLASLPALKHGSLISLDLSKNFLTDGFSHIENLTSLSFVDMTSNRIQYLSKAFLDSLDAGNTTVLLTDNPYNCTSCKILVFLRWLRPTVHGDRQNEDKIQDYRTLYCHRNTSLRLSDFRFTDLQNQCTSTLWIWLSISTISAIAMLTVCLGVAYRKRWSIRFWIIHAARRRYHRLPSTQYAYDAFLCHSSEDTGSVERIRKKLEGSEEFRLKLCIYYRDFPLGVPIVECVNDAIADSRYIVLLITNNFIKSQWCIYEFFMAKTKVFCEENRSRLIIVVLEELTDDVLRTAPRTLQNVMKNNIYLEWTDDALGQEQFWLRLRDGLRTEPPLYIP